MTISRTVITLPAFFYFYYSHCHDDGGSSLSCQNKCHEIMASPESTFGTILVLLSDDVSGTTEGRFALISLSADIGSAARH